jgi:hypothetical protein
VLLRAWVLPSHTTAAKVRHRYRPRLDNADRLLVASVQFWGNWSMMNRDAVGDFFPVVLC